MANQAYQIIRDVYSTIAATTTVKIRPGTRPSTEYDHGNDMIARQIYSEKSRAAVYYTNRKLALCAVQMACPVAITFCQLHVRYLMEFSASSSICLPTSPFSESDCTP